MRQIVFVVVVWVCVCVCVCDRLTGGPSAPGIPGRPGFPFGPCGTFRKMSIQGQIVNHINSKHAPATTTTTTTTTITFLVSTTAWLHKPFDISEGIRFRIRI